MEGSMKLYHAGFDVIEKPDIHHGRLNADFGQGFYTSGQEEFSKRWARTRRGSDTVINSYELDLNGLDIIRFDRDEKWFEYIYANRNHHPDKYADADVIIGPVANDTIYDTFGIITSGFLSEEQAMKLLMIGNVYEQIVIKSEKAACRLAFLGAQVLAPEEVASYRKTVAEEEAEYQKVFGEVLERI